MRAVVLVFFCVLGGTLALPTFHLKENKRENRIANLLQRLLDTKNDKPAQFLRSHESGSESEDYEFDCTNTISPCMDAPDQSFYECALAELEPAEDTLLDSFKDAFNKPIFNWEEMSIVREVRSSMDLHLDFKEAIEDAFFEVAKRRWDKVDWKDVELDNKDDFDKIEEALCLYIPLRRGVFGE